MIIRRERSADEVASRAVQASAFDEGAGEPMEARLLDELRRCEAWIPELSWVAEVDNRVVGHNVCTRGHVDEVACVGLGPIGVAPDLQRGGVGSALMHAIIGAADSLGEPLIALLGDPAYYSRFGFVPSIEVGVAPPQAEWEGYFQVLPLSTWSERIKGRFRYATPFEYVT